MKTGRVCRALVTIAALKTALFAFATPARAEVLWIELTQGDLSGDRFNPTPFTLNPGENELFGILAGADGQGGFDRDYFSIAVPSGHVLSQIVLASYSSPDFASFIGLQPGPIFPDDPDTVLDADLLGWAHFGPFQQDADLLAIMGTHGQRFVPPLPAGTYTFWAQQIDDFTEYTLNFVVEVPEPATFMSLAFGFMLLASGRFRRHSTSR